MFSEFSIGVPSTKTSGLGAKLLTLARSSAWSRSLVGFRRAGIRRNDQCGRKCKRQTAGLESKTTVMMQGASRVRSRRVDVSCLRRRGGAAAGVCGGAERQANVG